MMKTPFTYRIIYALYILLVMACISCKIPSLPQETIPKRIPDYSFSEKDTVSSATSPRRIFYGSPLLNRLIDTVVSNNYDHRIALQRLEMMRASLKQTQGMLIPQINLSGSSNLRKFGLYTMDGAGNIVTEMERGKLVPIDLPDYYFGFQATWEADLWGKWKHRKKAALARLLASEEGRKLVQTALVAETASAYYSLIAQDQILKLLDETILLQNQAVQTVKIQKQTAVVNELAVQQFEAQLLSMKAMRAGVLQKIKELEIRIDLLSGKTSNPIERDSLFFERDQLPFIQTGLSSSLLLNRPDIRQMEWELTAAKFDLQSARAAFLPEFRFNVGGGIQAYRTGLLFMFPESIAYSLLGGITGPVINRKFIQGEYQRANAFQKEALLQYEKTIIRAFLEVEQEIRNLSTLDETFQFKTKEREILTSSVQVSADLFKTGRATYLEVLTARQLALRSSIELIDTRLGQFLSSIRLYQSLGGGWR